LGGECRVDVVTSILHEHC